MKKYLFCAVDCQCHDLHCEGSVYKLSPFYCDINHQK